MLLIVRPPSSKLPFQLAPPWQGWEPDSNFLYELCKWNVAHKDDSLPVIFKNVASALDSKPPLQAALEFIPDSPFPAESLIKAMISLIQLGSVSDVSSHWQTTTSVSMLFNISHPPRKFLRRRRTSITFRIRSLFISLTWPKYLVRLEVVGCRRKFGKVCKLLGGQLRSRPELITNRIQGPGQRNRRMGWRKHHINMLQIAFGCLTVLQERLDIGTLAALLSPDFDVLSYMRRISIFMYNGELLAERTVPWLDGLVTGLFSSCSHHDIHINRIDHHQSLTITCFKNIERLTFNVGHITSSRWLYEKISISQSLTYAYQ